MTATAYLHLVLRLRVSGTVPLLPLYAFMVCTGISLPFCVSYFKTISKDTYVSVAQGCQNSAFMSKKWFEPCLL